MRANSEGVKEVGIWIRVSTEDQARGESPEHHERRARAYAEAKGWRVVEVYHLEGVSGKAVMAHPEAQRMLGDVRAGNITGLVFSKLARLARNTRELLDFAEIFRTCGADLISLQEAIDTGSPAGRMFFTMIAAMATWEREEIASRVQASIPIRAQLGKPLGGAAPYGYRWQDKKLVPHPEEAPVRVLVYELFAEHRRKKTVARILNERGYRARTGSPFSDTTVSRLIEDPTAKGLHRGNYTQTDDNSKNWSRKPESEWVYTEVAPIVSEDLWERCNAIVAHSKATRPQARKTQHLFAGYAYCECGQKMYVWSNSPKYICSACRTKIPVADLEFVYQSELRRYHISPDEIAAHVEAGHEAIREKEKLIERGQRELKKLEDEIERGFLLHAEGSLSSQDFGRRHKPLSARRAQLEEELPKLQAEIDVLRISLLSEQEVVGEARDLASRWEHLPFEQRRSIVEMITDRITVGKEEVEISLLYLPPPTASGKGADKATRAQGFIAATS